MIITNVTGAYFLKQNDTATQIRLLISEVDGTPVDLSLATKVEIVIGVPEGRVLVKTPKLLPQVGELEFGLDDGDIIPTGDDLLEVHIYNDMLEKRVAPSKGYYKLKVQKPIDEIAAEVTTYTLDYFLGEVNRITDGLPQLIVRAEGLSDQMDALIATSGELLDESAKTLVDAGQALTDANAAVQSTISATQDAITATGAATTATQNADAAAAIANANAQLALGASTVATTATTDANAARDAALLATQQANMARDGANTATQQAEDVVDDLLGYNIPIIDFSTSITFIKHQPARFNGSTFRAKKETTGNPLPVAPMRENEWWTLEAQRGTDGGGAVGSVNGILPDAAGNVNLGDLATDWESIGEKPSVFPPSTHRHDISQIDNLPDVALNGHHHPITEIANLQTTIDQLNASIAAIGQTGIPKLVSYQYVIPATTNGQGWVEIPLESFDNATDTLFLFRNTTVQSPSVYSISGRMITLTQPVGNAADTVFHIFILKNVPVGPDGSINASVLIDGSVSTTKLDQPLQTMIKGLVDASKESAIAEQELSTVTEQLDTRLTDHLDQYSEELATKLDNLPASPPGTDLNTLKNDYRLRGSNFMNGAVNGNTISIVEVKKYSQDWVIQKQHIIASNGTVITYERAFFNGSTWSAWRDVDTKVNALTQSVNELTAVPTTYELALPSGFSSGNIRYRKGANNLVELFISLNKESAFTTGALQIGTLPLGYYPINTKTGHTYFLDANGNLISTRADIIVTAEGRISISGVGDMTNARQIFNFSALFYAKVGV